MSITITIRTTSEGCSSLALGHLWSLEPSSEQWQTLSETLFYRTPHPAIMLTSIPAFRSGRKRACLLYVVLYSLSCLTKHSSDYYLLLLGRLLGGTSCSLLFSAFESWLGAEHLSRGFSPQLLVGYDFISPE